MFHCDFGWERLAAHVKHATAGNRATPEGRRFWPAIFWKATLYVTVPAFTSLLFLQLWRGSAWSHAGGVLQPKALAGEGCPSRALKTVPGSTSRLSLQTWVSPTSPAVAALRACRWQDLSAPYGGYPGGYQAFGWCLLVALMALTPLTMVKLDTQPGTLPPSGALGGGPRSSGSGGGLDLLPDDGGGGTSRADGLLRRAGVLLAGRMPVAMMGGRAQSGPSSSRGSAHRSAGSERALELSTPHQGTPDI